MQRGTLTATLTATQEVVCAPSSCGLDFWYSARALHWTGSYLHAKPTVLTVEDGTQCAEVLCLLRRLPGGLRLASAFPYGCIKGDANMWWRAERAIRHALIRQRVTRLEIPFSGESAAQLPQLLPAKSRARIAHAMDAVRHVFDIPSAATDIEKHFHPNIRWAIRKATRSGCSVRKARVDEVDTVQALYAATMRAKRAPVNYGPERWAGMLQDLAPHSCANIFIGEIDNRPAGIAAVVDAALSRHFIQLAVPPEFQSTRLGELLVATVLRDAQAMGKRWFDFMASPISDAGLIAFKSKWGTRAEPIRHVVVPGIPLMSPLVDIGRWLNRRARLYGK